MFIYSFFFFRLFPIRDRHSAKVFSIRLDQLRLSPLLQPSLCLLSPNPSIFSLAFLSFFYQIVCLGNSINIDSLQIIASLSFFLSADSWLQSWMSREVSRSRDTFLSVSVSLCQCLVSVLVSNLESLGKWSCLDRDMKKIWI